MKLLAYRKIDDTLKEDLIGVFFEGSDEEVYGSEVAFEVYKGIYILYYKSGGEMIECNPSYTLYQVKEGTE